MFANEFGILPQLSDQEEPIPLPGGVADEKLLGTINHVLRQHGLDSWTAIQLGRPDRCEVIDLNGYATLNPGRVRLNLKIKDGDQTYDTHLNVGGRFAFVIPIVTLTERDASIRPEDEGLHLLTRSRLEGRQEEAGWLKTFGPEEAATIRQFHLLGTSWEAPRKLLMEFDENRELDPFAGPAREVLQSAFGDDYVAALDQASVMPLGALRIKGEFALARAYFFRACIYGKLSWNDLRGRVIRIPLKKVRPALNRLAGLADTETFAVLSSAILKAPAGTFG